MPNVLITGVRPGGIAAACAVRLAREGWNAGLSCWGDCDPTSLLSQLRNLGVRAETVEADLTDALAPAHLFEELESRLGPFTGLIAAHSRDVETSLMSTTADEFARHFAVNATAVALLIEEFARRMPGDDGRVVAFTSDALENNVPYGASKAALDRIVKAAAKELGPRGVRCNCINPGPTETGWISDGLRAEIERSVPLGRTSLPDDAASLVAFLFSHDGGWITGQILRSNGGLR